MLQSMRDGMVSPFAKFLLFILAAAMVGFYGFSGSCGGAISENISATVDGTEISQVELSRAFQNMMAYQQSQGMDFNSLPPEMINMLQKQVLQGLIQQKLLLKQARALGMTMPKKAIKESIQKQFTQGGQSFSFEQYKNILARFGQTPAQFEKEQGEKIMVNSLYQAINATSKTPLHLLKANYAIDQTKAKVSYIKLNSEILENKLDIEQASQENLQNFYEQNKENYRIPEQRSFSLFWLDLKNFLPQPNNDDLNKTLKSAYSPEQREKLSQARYHARHILISGDNSKNKAQKIYRRLLAGASFRSLAMAESEDPGSKTKGGDLGYFAADTMVPEFKQAVESLKVGQISAPVKSSFGYHVIELLDKIKPGPSTVERLNKELSFKWQSVALEQKKYKDSALDAAKKVFAKQATERNYKNINQNDNLPQIPDNNDTSIIMGKVMSAKVNEKTEMFTAASTDYLYQIQLNQVNESYIPNYNTLAKTVKADYLQQAYQKAFATLIAQKNQALLKQEITDLQSLANELDLSVQTSNWFSAKDASKLNSDLSLDDLKPALSMQKNTLFPKTIVKGKDHYILSVTDIQTPDWSQFDTTAAETNRQDSQKVNQWIDALKDNAEIEIAPELQGS
ncbi:SurA N-terminal domain-containing protein [bacterium]|nr:SurA N-terminal domain-containing protein [bacterium]